MDKVSIIGTLYNEDLKIVKKNLNNLLNQTYKNIEIIFVMDNPKNVKLINFLKENYDNNEKLTIIFNEKNLGKAKSRNKGINLAKGKYITFQDGDDVSKIDRIERQLNTFKKLEKKYNTYKIALFGSFNKIYLDENNNIIEKKSNIIKENENDIRKLLFAWKAYLLPTMFVNRNELIKNNLFFKLRTFPEEFELFFRMIKKDYIFYNSEDIIYDYYIYPKENNYFFDTYNYGSKKFLSLMFENYSSFKNYIGYKKTIFIYIIIYLISRNKTLFLILEKLRRILGIKAY